VKKDIPRQSFAVWTLIIVIAHTITSCAVQHGSNERDKALISVGEMLFHDTSLSIDGRLSCASCHQPARHFTDQRPTSIGANHAVGTRNAPSLLDISMMTTLFWDGRDSRLEDVVLQPFTNAVEMGLQDHDTLVGHVSRKAEYRESMRKAFGHDLIRTGQIAAALTAYLRALPTNPTRYDRYVQSESSRGLSDDEIHGLSLFKGKAGCVDCHRLDGSPVTFTDNLFHHTGIGFEKVAGNITQMVRRLDHLEREGQPLGKAILTDADVAELGRFASTRRSSDLGAFRTPSLRNVALTAPYMHDGSVPTLEEAVEREIYYRSLARGRPISLTVEEQFQLVAFLKALSTAPLKPAQTADKPLRILSSDSTVARQ